MGSEMCIRDRPCPVLRFYKPPDFVHTAPDFVHTATQHGRSLAQDLSHNWQVADCDDCDAAAAEQRSAVTDEQLRANNLYHLNPTRKIPHTTGELRKRAPSRKKRYLILFRNHPGIPDFVNFPCFFVTEYMVCAQLRVILVAGLRYVPFFLYVVSYIGRKS